jgi:serine/threonine protein kinase/tetratricopeptide (TPR) repeat protein
MTPQQWDQIKTLFDRALDLPPGARSGYVTAACTDPEVLRAVRDLLKADGNADSRLGQNTSRAALPPVFCQDQRVADRFRIIRFRGRGGMGEVYEAYDERLQLRVGLKTIRHDWAPGKEALDRFRREIRIARKVSHPNLCRVFDLLEHQESSNGSSGVVTCLTMEWLEGETLQTHIEKSRPWPVEKALPIIRQIAAAIDALHQAGIVHRDLKPGNVILVPQQPGKWRVVVTDFGLAKPLSDGDEYFESQTDAQAGAPYFMAPELLRNQKSTSASDIFAFGLIVDELVTETRAFNAGSIGALYYQRLWEAPIPPGRRSPQLPAVWESVVLRCLANDPAARYSTAGEAVRALEGEAPVTPPLPATAAKVIRSFWSRARVAVFLAAALLMAVTAFALHVPHLQTSMVVFQIEDLVGDAAYHHLSGGLTAELVSRLTHVDGLNVKQFHGTRDKASLNGITERFYLDGDLQKFQTRIRLNMRLTDTEKTNSVVWSRSFDHDLNNPLELEAEVAKEVVDGLQDRIFADASSRMRMQFAGYRIVRSFSRLLGANSAQATTQSPAAYHAYLRGHELLENRTPADVREAIDSLAQAVTLDSSFAPAYALLSDAYRAVIDGRQGPQEELIGRSLRYAQKAISLNPQLPEAYAALAGVQQMQWQWEASEQSYREAIRLDPKSPVAYRRFGGLIIQFGRFDEAMEYVKKGLELDPYDYPGHAAYGLCLMMARRYREAEEHLRWTLAKRDFISAHYTLALVYSAWGREATGEESSHYFDLAQAQARAVHDMEVKGAPDPETFPTPISDYLLALAYAMRGDSSAAHRSLDRLTSRPDIGQVSPANLSMIYCALSEADKAVTHLRQAVQIKDRGLLYLKVAPFWDPIRQTEDYRQALLTMRM